MAVRNDLAPLPVVKSWAKRLVKAWPEVSASPTNPSLSICQEAIARVLGHPDWHGLLRSYDTPTGNYGGTEMEPFELNGDTSSGQTMNYLQKILMDAIDQGYSALHIERSEEKAIIKGRKGDKITDILITTPAHTDRIMTVFYNVLAEHKDVSFKPMTTQTATARVLHGDKSFQLSYRATPRLPAGYYTVIEIFPVGPSMDNHEAANSPGVQLLTQTKEGFVFIAAPSDNSRCAALSGLGIALSNNKQTIVLSDRYLPQLETVRNATLIPIIKRLENASNSLIEAVRIAIGTPHNSVLVDCKVATDEDWKALEIIRQNGGPCFVAITAPSMVDVLIQLDRAGRLRDLLKYGLLRAIAMADPSLDKTASPISKIILLTSDTQTKLMDSGPHQWESILNQAAVRAG